MCNAHDHVSDRAREGNGAGKRRRRWAAQKEQAHTKAHDGLSGGEEDLDRLEKREVGPIQAHPCEKEKGRQKRKRVDGLGVR